MIYFSGIYLVLMSLAWSFCSTAGLSLEEQLKVSHRYFICFIVVSKLYQMLNKIISINICSVMSAYICKHTCLGVITYKNTSIIIQLLGKIN